METIYTVLAVVACILLFSFAVFIHEFGHFVAAKLLGFKVEVFSIGFGPALWKKTYKGVEYRISAIPFGGYVALPQLDPEGTKAIENGLSSRAMFRIVQEETSTSVPLRGIVEKTMRREYRAKHYVINIGEAIRLGRKFTEE